MKVNSQTRISAILKHNLDAVEAIAAINPHFHKLRNPILRRVLAPRVTVADAARIGGCESSDILNRLQAIGFDIENNAATAPEKKPVAETAGALEDALRAGRVHTLDVRPILAGGTDPFQKIMAELETLKPGQVLEVVNTFEPVPLIKILSKKGYLSKVETGEGIVRTYFLKPESGDDHPVEPAAGIFEVSLDTLEREKSRFQSSCRELDVRDLEMPLPMLTILSALEEMPEGEALYVHHKKVPQYLLPELAERQFKAMISDIAEGNVKMLIYR